MSTDDKNLGKPPALFTGYGHHITAAQRADWQSWQEASAQAAFKNGTHAALKGHHVSAIYWLERAARMAVDDINAQAALGFAYSASGNWRQALKCFDLVAAKANSSKIEVARGVALFKIDRRDDALRLVQQILQKNAPLPEFAPLAERVLANSSCLGWAGVKNPGVVIGASRNTIDILLDGQLIASGVNLPFKLPASWTSARELRVMSNQTALLGSPVNLCAIRESEGFVQCNGARVSGWVWYPHDPESVAEVVIRAGRRITRLTPTTLASEVNRVSMLRGAREFSLTLNDIAPDETIFVTDLYGRDVMGSPITPEMRKLLAAPQRVAKRRQLPAVQSLSRPKAHERRSGCLVIVPAYKGFSDLLACLNAVRASLSGDVELLVIDDCSPDDQIKRALKEFAADGWVTLVENDQNLGFIKSANKGLARAQGRDVILLNSDARFYNDGIDRLLKALHSADDIGTATPLSNNATIFSFPHIDTIKNGFPQPEDGAFYDRVLTECGSDEGFTVPTGHGFCLAIRAECLTDTGVFRDGVFAQGYGEENDFCQRASGKGWRHIAASRVYVAHRGQVSFGAATKDLNAQNMRILERLHPGYHAAIAAFIALDPLSSFRNRAVKHAITTRQQQDGRRIVVLLTHDAGGGVERVVQQRVAMHRAQGLATLLVRPHEVGCTARIAGFETGEAIFSLPKAWDTFIAFIKMLSPVFLEIHHMVGHAPVMHHLRDALDVSYDVFIHDYAWFCPRVTLLSFNDQYCGEPDLDGCIRCVAQLGTLTSEDLPVPDLVARSAATLSAARRVVAPCHDASARMTRHFAALPIVVSPPSRETVTRAKPHRKQGKTIRVCVVGAIGREKGYDVLLRLAQYAAAYDLALEILVVGHTSDDDALMATGKVRVTGEYVNDADAISLINAFLPDWGFIPSIWPETWCFTLSILIAQGIKAVVFDLGAQAERVRALNCGVVVSLRKDIKELADILMKT